MKLLAEIKKKLICLKKDHMQEQIYYICQSQQCQSHSLCCYLCQQQSHKGHQMQSIKILLSKIQQIQNISDNVLTLSAELDEKMIKIHSFLHSNRKQLMDFGVVLRAVDAFMDVKKRNVLGLLELPGILGEIVGLPVEMFQQQIVGFFDKYYHYLQLEDDNDPHLDIYNCNLKSVISELKSIEQSLQKLKKADKINDREILALFPLEDEQFRTFKPCFSQSLKGAGVKVTATTAEMVSAGSQRVIAMQPSLQLSNKVKKWKIKITKLASWIGVGVCHINKLKQANWHFNYSSTQHGSYFISSNGYSWSSYKPEFNSKFEPFSFKTGDTICLEYHPKDKRLLFQKQNPDTSTTNPKYELEIENNGDQVHPAINLTGVGDSVQLIL